MTQTTQTGPVSPWAPFRHRAFFWLWLGVVVSSVGSWAQTVGAQWLFVHDPNAATIVTLVQTASTLPMMLLALPAGVLADAFDRRWLMFGVQSYFIAVAVLLAVLTAAARLDMVSVNVARAAGPALAGVVIARWGVPPVFAMTAFAASVLAVVLLKWRRPRVSRGEREAFLPALVAGGRYVRHEPVVKRILVRFASFMVPACAVWALLPLIASPQLGLEADGYGLLFAALGLGAVIGALCLGWVRQHLSSNGVLALAGASFAFAFGSLVLAPNAWVAFPLLVVCGFGWTATVSTIISELQLFLPNWVRARAIAIYLMVFLGSQAVASPIWGLVTQQLGLRVAVLAAAALVGASAIGGLVLKVPENQHLDSSPVAYWGAAAPHAGTCTGSGKARACSWSSFKSRPGANTSASTTAALPPRTRRSRTPRSPISWEPRRTQHLLPSGTPRGPRSPVPSA